ncbi:phage tail tape measure protein [Achromobacter sp. D10]|uniref:phage tail tape measure protein n=1 Tax=Achromobacter sp. D10 TaxID=3110765 RepID=UPI002B46C9C2|nr:phage tail tape measure protein [Achromobacter sp. D10]MEB3098841.1 phage tail tape measure protein [Achromobacter sp. D10]
MSDVVGKATLEFGADNSGVKSAVQEVGREVSGMASVAAAAAVKASGSLKGIGVAGEGAAQKLSSAQQRARQSLERLANTLGRSRAEVAEYRAQAAGLPRDVYEPLVAKIREAEAAMGGLSAGQRAVAASGAQAAQSEAQTAARYRDIGQAAVERAAALQRQVEHARAAAVAERELSAATSGAPRGHGAGALAGQNRGFQELTRDINEVNAALAAIERGAGSQAAIQAQTDKLVSLWNQGRITAEQYGAAVKRLDASEAALARSSAQAAAQGDRFIAGLREQAETAGMTARQLLEYRAAQLGVGDRAGPLIARLAQVNKDLDGTGISARQTAAAMRMVPAQMTDIATQLAGGQNPFLIMIQQGGQLKDSFGGLVPMFRALLGMVTPFSLAVGGVGAALALMGTAFYKGSSEVRDYGNSLILTGNYAGQTAQSLVDMSRRVGEARSTVGRSADVLNRLVASGRVAGSSLEMVASSIVNMSETGARSVDDLVAEFMRLGESPSQAVAKINESMHFLDAATYDRIRALEQQGQKEQAVALAQATLADATNRAADRVRASAGTLERGWHSLGLAARQAWDAMLNVGRPTPIGELRKQLAELERQAEGLQNNQGFHTTDGGAAVGAGRNRSAQQLKRLQADIALRRLELERQERAEAVARGEALRGHAMQEEIAAGDRLRELMKSTRDRAQIRADEIKQMQDDAKKANWSAQQIAEAEKRINEKYKDPKGAGGAYKDDAATRRLAQLREQEASLAAQLAGERKLTDAGKARAQFEQEIADLKGKSILTAEQRSLLANQDAIRAQLEKNEGLAKELVAKQEIVRLEERSAQIQQAMASAGESRREQYERQLSTVGMGQQARERAEAERSVRQEFRRYEDQLAKATPKDQLGSEQYREAQLKIREALQGALEDQRAYYAQLDSLNGNWRAGYSEAWADYQDQVRNVAQQSQSVFANAFKGMEDALVNFAMTGKLKFREFASSVIADLARIAARQAVIGLVGSLVGALGGGFSSAKVGGSMTGNLSGMSGSTWNAGTAVLGGRAIGGPVSARGMYEINERGRPETLNSGGKQFLLMGSQSGFVSPLAPVSAGSSAGGEGVAPVINVSVTVASDGRDSSVSSNEDMGRSLGDAIAATVRDQIHQSWRPGGLSHKHATALAARR